MLSSPHQTRLAPLLRWQKAAPAFHFQTVPSAAVAIPSGTVRSLLCSSYEMKCDSQFFLSFSLSPHSVFTAESASVNNSSGPISIRDSAVAGEPFSSSPRISSTPQSR